MTTTRIMRSVALAAALSVPGSVAAAEADCYEIAKTCTDALEDANWLEKIAIGNLCTVMLLGCAVS